MSYALGSVIAAGLAALAVLLHYEALNLLDRVSRLFDGHRSVLLLVMLGLLAAHVVEIWVFALGFATVDAWASAPLFEPSGLSLRDYAYFSAMVYTTVGFGDIVPQGAMRMLTSAEALTGLALITWSASYTFLHMRKRWD